MNIQNRPETTLFLLVSVDGKITTGDSDKLDTDRDYRKIKGVREGLQQYYDLELKTDRVSLNTGRVMVKIGVNTKNNPINCPDVSFVIIDSKPHLTKDSVANLVNNLEKLYLVTSNKNHPGFQLEYSKDRLVIIYQPKKVNFQKLFKVFKNKYKISKITVQSGGTLNATLLREGLIDHLSVVVAPVLIGGKDTSSLIEGESLYSQRDLHLIKALKLVKTKVLKNSYLHLYYDVNNDTQITN